MFNQILLIVVLAIGFTLVYLGWKKSEKFCKPTVEYRFIPRTFREESENPVKVTEIFDRMFKDTSIIF